MVVAPSARTPRSVMHECPACQHHASTAGTQTGGQALGNLLSQPLLSPRPGREVLDQPGQLGQAQDALSGQVANMGEAGKGQQMVLADRPGPGWPRASTSSS